MLNRDEITGVMSRHRSSPSERVAQSRLALEVTQLVHGSAAAETAQAVTGLLTGAVTLQAADSATIDLLRQEQPSYTTAVGASIIEALTEVGLATSNSSARQLLADNAISINGRKVDREVFQADDFVDGHLLLRRGKKYKDTALIELG